jgi:hypothetical protein
MAVRARAAGRACCALPDRPHSAASGARPSAAIVVLVATVAIGLAIY